MLTRRRAIGYGFVILVTSLLLALAYRTLTNPPHMAEPF